MGKNLRFMSEGGEMGRLIRERDWSGTPFGPPQQWPQSLRSTLGICLKSSIPTAIYWGPELLLLYNDAWSFIPGPRHPEALGQPAREVWYDIWHVIGPQFAEVFETRRGFSTREQLLPMERFGEAEETYWDYSFTPISGENGDVVGILNQGQDVTEQVFARRRAQLLLELDAALRPLRSTQEVFDVALEMLGREIDVERLGYGELDEAVESLTIEACRTRGELPDITGEHRLGYLGAALQQRLREGAVMRVEDIETETALDEEEEVRERYRAAGIRAGLVVPILEHGRYAASVFAHSTRPRHWLDHHVALLGAVGERIWQAVARTRGEAELRDSERRYRLIFEQAHDIIFTATLDQRITACNPAAAKALGLPREEIVGRSIADFVAAEDYRNTTRMLRHKLAHGGTTRYDVTVSSASGEQMLWEINSTLAVDRDNKAIGLHAIARDITARRAAEDRQQLLINELNHRVKNTLALVQSLAQQSFRNHRDPDAAVAAFEERLIALSAAHDLLTREKWEGATMRSLVADAVAPHRRDETRITMAGPDARLSPSAAVSLVLALNELCTNAAKYGALSEPGGHVDIAWTVTGDRLRIEWSEHDGPPVSEPTHRGFGLRMIERALASDLDGDATISFELDGLRCTIEATLPATSSRAAA